MKKTLRIAMIGQKGIPARYGGVETHVENVATRLVARGHEVWTFCRSRFSPARLGAVPPEGYRVDGRVHSYRGVRLAYRGSLNSKHLDAASHTFLCALESSLRHHFDVLHFHGIGPSAFVPVPKLFGKKVVSTFHALDWRQVKWGSLASKILKRGEAAGARRSDGVIAVSKIMRRYIEDRYGVKARYIPNGATFPPPETGGDVDRFGLAGQDYVLTVGRIIRDRGIHHVIEAFKQLPPPLRLVVVGSETPRTAYTAQLQALADDRVVFTGNVFGDALDALYANALVYVLASNVEGLPTTVCEAMAHGKPLLLSDIPENREAAADAAMYFNVGDVSGLRGGLKALLEDKAEAAWLSAQGRERVRNEFNWDTIAEQIEAFYFDVLNI